MPTLTLYNAPRGARYTNAEGGISKSTVGHTFFTVTDNNGNVRSFGFANEGGSSAPVAPGQVHINDNTRYIDIDYKRTITISQAQYDALLNYGDNPGQYGFDVRRYNVVSNSCVTFVWGAISILDPANPEIGQHGGFPTWNNKPYDRALDRILANGDTPVSTRIIRPVPPRCFLAGTPIDMADGAQKPIERIKAGDMVMSFDGSANRGRGALVPQRVTRTTQNVSDTIIDLRGLKMTPGHVMLTGEGGFAEMCDILRDDRTIVERYGRIEYRDGIRMHAAWPTDWTQTPFETAARGFIVRDQDGEDYAPEWCGEGDEGREGWLGFSSMMAVASMNHLINSGTATN